MTTPRQQKPTKKVVWASRFLFFGIALLALCGAAFLLFLQVQRNFRASQIVQDGGDPSLGPTERLYLQAYLAARVNDLNESAGSLAAPTTFVVDPGESAGQIADKLLAAEAISDRELFLNYVRYYGIDNQLEAGNFLIQPDLTLPQLAETLTHATAEEVVLTFLEGWRLEEMARYLAQREAAAIDAAEFLAITQRRQRFDLTRYDFLSSHPPDTSLEGYLFPDTYRLPLDADASHLVNLMLENFGARVTPAMRQAFGTQSLSLRDAVTLASVVEREAVLDEEKGIIAGVFLNRLRIDMLLQADPTVQYAVGYWAEADAWWKSPLWLDDLQLDSAYNTYLYPGLMPGPIASPGLESLWAVANPTPTDYIFFVADCNIQGAHLFSQTLAQHEENVSQCR